MKSKLIVIFSALSLLSVTANAADESASFYHKVRNGSYATYSEYCGMHVEKSQGRLVLTFTNNALYPAVTCTQIGHTKIAACNLQANNCDAPAVAGHARSRYEILEDGNILQWVVCSDGEVGPVKFLFYR